MQAFFTAVKVLDLWKKVDKSNDRMVSVQELAAIVPSECLLIEFVLQFIPFIASDADKFMAAADANGDGVLTFAEFAWQMSNHFQNKEGDKCDSEKL